MVFFPSLVRQWRCLTLAYSCSYISCIYVYVRLLYILLVYGLITQVWDYNKRYPNRSPAWQLRAYTPGLGLEGFRESIITKEELLLQPPLLLLILLITLLPSLLPFVTWCVDRSNYGHSGLFKQLTNTLLISVTNLKYGSFTSLTFF